MTPFDSTTLAANGLRRGVTTGTCATAAVKAALTRLLYGEICDEVRVTLPDQAHFISIPIKRIIDLEESVQAEVVKDAGDDPDQTHRATLVAKVSRNKAGRIQFLRGPGVGLVTERGLQIPIGEPAINPVPREMMQQAVLEVLSETETEEEEGFDLEIGCERGEEIAKRTFNPRLGIVGGISILGTTGIVEPKSMAAFKAAIEIYIDVALADNPEAIVLTPGNLGQRFARASLGLPMKRVVQMSNFVGFSLAHMEKSLTQTQRLPRLWLAGHPGKLAKLLENIWDTHSSEGGNGVRAVTRFAEELGLDSSLRTEMERCTTVEGIIEVLGPHACADSFWRGVSERIAQLVAARLTRIDEVRVRLFKMDGTPLGVEA
jgi:cobalt-precorrin-5B (C1)-methyltransferase